MLSKSVRFTQSESSGIGMSGSIFLVWNSEKLISIKFGSIGFLLPIEIFCLGRFIEKL
jgi:hypothetical protein